MTTVRERSLHSWARPVGPALEAERKRLDLERAFEHFQAKSEEAWKK